jgi:hypothetical protein
VLLIFVDRRMVRPPETFNFLGFTFVCGTSRRGQFLIKRKTRRDRMRAKLRELKWLTLNQAVEKMRGGPENSAMRADDRLWPENCNRADATSFALGLKSDVTMWRINRSNSIIRWQDCRVSVSRLAESNFRYTHR